MNADQASNDSLSTRRRFISWLQFLVFLICLIMVPSAAEQVYEHWEPTNGNVFLYVLSSFFSYLWPRLLFGAAIGVTILAFAMLFKQRPPWLDAE